MMARSAFRTAWWLGLLCAVAISACRELVASPEQLDETSISIQVLGLDGEPRTSASINIFNRGFVSYTDQIEWYGELDENGFVYPDIPPGPYSIRIQRSSRSPDPEWARPRIELGDQQVTLDPRSTVQYGRLSVPAELPFTSMDLEFETRIQLDQGYMTFRARTDVDDDGRFTFVWPAEGDFDAAISGPGLAVLLDRDLAIPAADSLSLSWNPLRLEATLQFGDEPLPLSEVWIEAKALGARTSETVPVVGSTISFWTNPGAGSLRISPRGSTPFLDRTVFLELGTAEPIVIELGEHLVEFRFVSSDGGDIYGPALGLRPSSTDYSEYFYPSGSEIQLYLRTDEFLLHADASLFQSIETVATITQDTTFTFVLEPESDLAP